jgi:phospholipase C
MPIERRQFLQTLLSGAVVGTTASLFSASAQEGLEIPTLLTPEESGIEHIVVVTMENRSFDHFLGWLPGANGIQAGLTYTDASGTPYDTYPLAPDYSGCSHPNPDHSYTGGRVEYNDGAMDGFLRSDSDILAVGYYTEADIPFLGALAQTYRTCANWFASFLGPTFPNRLFLWSAQTDRLSSSFGLTSLPTILDRLSTARVSHRYYFSDLPFLSLWGFKYIFSAGMIENFLRDAAEGNLPAVSFVDPAYITYLSGSNSDEVPADIRNGEAFLSDIFHALATGPKWQNTVLIIHFDEWGGFFEHVIPPRVVAPNNVDPDMVNGESLLGFRIPAVIASPFTFGGGIELALYDHTSVLELIEWRFNLDPLTPRDSSPAIGNPATTFNFATPNSSLPAVPQPTPVQAACFPEGLFEATAEPIGIAASSVPAQVVPSSSLVNWAQSPVVRAWQQHPRFGSKLKKRLKH